MAAGTLDKLGPLQSYRARQPNEGLAMVRSSVRDTRGICRHMDGDFCHLGRHALCAHDLLPDALLVLDLIGMFGWIQKQKGKRCNSFPSLLAHVGKNGEFF